MNLGQLEKITDLRDVWKTEAQHFSPWLAKEKHQALLGNTIGLDLELETGNPKMLKLMGSSVDECFQPRCG